MFHPKTLSGQNTSHEFFMSTSNVFLERSVRCVSVDGFVSSSLNNICALGTQIKNAPFVTSTFIL